MTTPGTSARAFAGRFLIALVVGSLLMGAAVAGVNREVGRKLDRIPKIELTTAPVPPGGANYLLVGSDTRDFVENDLEREAFGDTTVTDGKRSDTIMVVHVEPKAERTFIVSFPRDLWVNIPGHGMSKINGAYNYGPQAVIETLKQNFDVDVNHYIELNFKTFVGLVDSLGKVKVYVPYPARDDYTGLDIQTPGCVELDGEQSLQYVRSRYLEYLNPDTGRWVSADIVPDIGRIARQQEFMRRLAGLAVVRSLGNPFTANDVADEVIRGLTVDDAFDKSSVFDLIEAFRTINLDDQSALEFVTLPWKTGPNQAGQSVLYPDTGNEVFGAIVDRLRTFDETPKPTPAPSEIRVRVVNASGRAELGVAAKRRLEELGFQVVGVEENGKPRLEDSKVRYAPGALPKGKLALRYLDPLPTLDLAAADLGTTPAGVPVDVEVLLGRTFSGIVVPAGVAATIDTAMAQAVATAEPATVDVPDAPLEVPVTPTTLPASLPAPAPRGAC
jgi:LCP family protein required for cell wall assembly